ncbi:FG-GAP repeat domain-containing protein [Sorangium sp. So ce233]|uniref:FG-GAP repeat domain-containing protein n=1 Tax=Sorangium sp. So ce233 TaxID=3133290 RepID=UPI003F61F694
MTTMQMKMGMIRGALVALGWMLGGCSDEATQPTPPADAGGAGAGGAAGAGGYQLAGAYPASGGAKARLVAVGDLDGDGANDVVLAGVEGASAVVLRNTGDGALEPVDTIALGGAPAGVFLAAIDADPALDLLTIRSCDAFPCAAVEIYPGVGDGTFEPAVVALEVPDDGLHEPMMAHAALGDLDGDGLAEIYASQNAELAAWLIRRTGDGSFTSESVSALEAPALVDLDGDGELDLAGGERDADLDSTMVIRNEGGGSFTMPAAVADTGASAIATGDLNTDGNQDLVVVHYSSLSLLFGAGDAATFSRDDWAFEAPVLSPVVTDFDGDGDRDDVLVLQGDSVNVLIGEGDTFRPAPAIQVGSELLSLAVADMNGDAHPDLLVTRSETGDLAVLLWTP